MAFPPKNQDDKDIPTYKPEEDIPVYDPSKENQHDISDHMDTSPLAQATIDFLNKHPKGVAWAKRFIFGPSKEESLASTPPEFQEARKKLGLSPEFQPVGPAFSKIPGTDYLANKASDLIDPSQSPWYSGVRPFLGGAAKQGIQMLGAGIDPRAASLGRGLAPEEPPIPVGSGRTPAAAANMEPPAPMQLHGQAEQPLLPQRTQTGINQTLEQFGKTEPTSIAQTLREKLNPELPDETTQEPLMARSETGGIKAGVNTAGAWKELTSGYSQTPIKVAVREAMQNAMDAANKMGDKGQVSVKTADKYFEIKDNGQGMDRNDLETVFSNLHESGKSNDPNAIGGKGVGAATYITGGQKLELTSVKDVDGKKVETTTGGTPQEFQTNWDVTEKVVPDKTPTGTTIRMYYTPEQEKRSYEAGDAAQNIIKTTRDMPISVKFNKYGMNTEGNKYLEDAYTKTHQIAKTTDDKIIADRNINGNRVIISVPKDVPSKDETQYIKTHYLNNGMWQFSGDHYTPEPIRAPGELNVNIQPSAKESTPEYPFPTQRESIKTDLQNKINDLINETIVNPSIQGNRNAKDKLYGSQTPFDIGGTFFKNGLYDVGDKLTSDEKTEFLNSPVMKTYAKTIDSVIADILDRTDKPEWSNNVEKVGVGLAPEWTGIHIPRGADKSAIYINPFPDMKYNTPFVHGLLQTVTMLHEVSHIDRNEAPNEAEISLADLQDHRIGEFMQSYLKEMMEQGGQPGHGVTFLKNLAYTFSKFGPERTFDAAAKLARIFSDESGGYNADTQRLLQIYTESRGRTGADKDILTTTGIKQATRSSDEGDVSGDDNTDGKGSDTKSAVDKIIRAIREAEPVREEQEQLYTEERGKRINQAKRVKSDTRAGFYAQLAKLKGKLPTADFEAPEMRLTPDEIDSLFKSVNETPGLDEFQRINTKTGIDKLLKGELPQRHELKLMRQVFGEELGRTIDWMSESGQLTVRRVNAMRALKKIAGEVNVFKSMMASYDLSAPLRQGLGLIYRKEWWQALAPMIKAWSNKQYYNDTVEAIEDDPLFQLAKIVKLGVTDTETLENREEVFLSETAEKYIPGVAASERSYMLFLNKLRFDTFKSLYEDYRNANPDAPVEDKIAYARDIARFVNTSTGRGTLGPLERYAGLLNAGLFSPRMMASRLQMLNPFYYASMPPGMRFEVWKPLLAIAGTSIIVNELMKHPFGAKLTTNPTNADFMKSRFGNFRLDPNTGLQQYVVYLARFLSGQEQSSTTGRTTKFGEGYQPMDRLKLTGDFISNKESPVAGLVHTMLKGQDQEGNRRNILNPMDDAKEIGQRLIPMVAGDIYAAMRQDPKLVALAPLIIGGMGSQVYSQKPPKAQFRQPTLLRHPPMLH